MAGNGSRFKNIGIDIPKYEIIAKGKTLFEWSMISLTDFFKEEFIFITRKSNSSREFISSICKKLEINNYTVYELDYLTDGQASTIMAVEDLIDDSDEIVIYNIDTYIEADSLKIEDISNEYEGYIPCFKAEGNKWSFILYEGDKVVEITEKIRISD